MNRRRKPPKRPCQPPPTPVRSRVLTGWPRLDPKAAAPSARTLAALLWQRFYGTQVPQKWPPVILMKEPPTSSFQCNTCSPDISLCNSPSPGAAPHRHVRTHAKRLLTKTSFDPGDVSAPVPTSVSDPFLYFTSIFAMVMSRLKSTLILELSLKSLTEF